MKSNFPIFCTKSYFKTLTFYRFIKLLYTNLNLWRSDLDSFLLKKKTRKNDWNFLHMEKKNSELQNSGLLILSFLASLYC